MKLTRARAKNPLIVKGHVVHGTTMDHRENPPEHMLTMVLNGRDHNGKEVDYMVTFNEDEALDTAAAILSELNTRRYRARRSRPGSKVVL